MVDGSLMMVLSALCAWAVCPQKKAMRLGGRQDAGQAVFVDGVRQENHVLGKGCCRDELHCPGP